MRRIAIVILAALLAAFGAACMGDDEGEQSRRPAALGEEPAPGDEGNPSGTQPSPPPPPPAWPNGEGNPPVWEFRGSAEALLQPPLGVRVAIEGTLPPGRYYLYAKINIGSFSTPSTPITPQIGSLNWCDLKAGTVVLDRTYTSHNYPGGYATTVLLAKHTVIASLPSQATVKVVCKNGTGGSIGSRVLTAMKVG